MEICFLIPAKRKTSKTTTMPPATVETERKKPLFSIVRKNCSPSNFWLDDKAGMAKGIMVRPAANK